MKRYWNLLALEPLLARLSLIQLIAYFGAWFSNVAIYTLLIQLHVNASTIAFVAALHFFAGVLQAPLSGVIIDRISPKKLMIFLTITEIVATVLLISIDDVSKLGWLYLLVFIRMGAASFQFTVEMSLLPKIVEGKALQYANEIHSIIWSFSYTFGMALGGAVVYYIGTTYA
ncbi:MAG: MFS transporter, partial [Sulfuricurvum sp.]